MCTATSKVASIAYISMIAVFVMFALYTRYDGGDIVIGGTGENSTASSLVDKMMHMAIDQGIHYAYQGQVCDSSYKGGWIVCCADKCGGVYSVYRFSFALFSFFAIMALLTAGTTKFGARMHRCFWPVKIFVLLGLLCCTLLISNDFLLVYREMARYASIVFLGLQILLLIEAGYAWNEKWLEYDEKNECEGSCCGWRTAILIASLGMYVASLVLWILMYVFFGKEGCGAQLTITTLTIILCIVLTGIACSKLAPHGTILTSGVVTLYASYLGYSALASNPDKNCNPLAEGSMESASDLTMGLLVAGISIAVTANSATGNKELLLKPATGTSTNSDLSASLEDGTPKESSSEEDGDKVVYGRESWWYYHVMMIACSLYMAMLLTDWSNMPAEKNGVPAVEILEDARSTRYGVDIVSFWIKLTSQWICMLMYGWTLIAPYCLRDVRDFGVEFEF